MSIREYLDYNGNFNMSSIITQKANIGGAVHTNDANGYKITSSNGNNLLAFDKYDNIAPSRIKANIDAVSSSLIDVQGQVGTVQTSIGNVQSTLTAHTSSLTNLSTALTSHETRLTTLEASTGGNGGQVGTVPSLGQVLTVSNDAQNSSIINLDSIYINSGHLTTADVGGLTAQNAVLGINNQQGMLIVDNASNRVYSDTASTLEGFQTITDIQNSISTFMNTANAISTRLSIAETYISNLKKFFNAFNQGATITDPTNGLDFNFSNLL